LRWDPFSYKGIATQVRYIRKGGLDKNSDTTRCGKYQRSFGPDNFCNLKNLRFDLSVAVSLGIHLCLEICLKQKYVKRQKSSSLDTEKAHSLFLTLKDF
jgi:hypothetical protein